MPQTNDFLKQIEIWWSKAKIDPEHKLEVLKVCKQIILHKSRYMTVQKATGIAWFFVGWIHQKECSLDFKKVLHNGELLSDVNRRGTTIVPKGLGKGKNWTWEEAAIDALLYDKMQLKDLSTLPKMFDAAERYNGLGYRKKGKPSIYVWSHTNVSNETGKFVSDGKWSDTAKSKNAGVAALALGMMELGETLL